MKKYFCLAFTILLHVANLFSQGNDYRLRIKNAATSEAVEYAAVYFGDNRGSYTNENGEIKIPFDIKEIEISHLLYETKRKASFREMPFFLVILLIHFLFNRINFKLIKY